MTSDRKSVSVCDTTILMTDRKIPMAMQVERTLNKQRQSMQA